MPATAMSGQFTAITRGDAFFRVGRRVASGAVAAMGRSYRSVGHLAISSTST